MGEYNIKWGDDTILVDGHVCIRMTDFIYKVTDTYMIDCDEWTYNEDNAALSYFGEYGGTNSCDKVLYIYYDIPVTIDFFRRLPRNNKTYVYVNCVHSGV